MFLVTVKTPVTSQRCHPTSSFSPLLSLAIAAIKFNHTCYHFSCQSGNNDIHETARLSKTGSVSSGQSFKILFKHGVGLLNNMEQTLGNLATMQHLSDTKTVALLLFNLNSSPKHLPELLLPSHQPCHHKFSRILGWKILHFAEFWKPQ